MSIAHQMIAELEQEAVATRKFLERVPADRLTWKPHDKSLTAGQLALHIATIPGNIADMAVPDECPPPDFSEGFKQPETVDEIVSAFDDSVARAKTALGGMDDGAMAGTWKLVAGGQELMALPRGAFLRTVMLNHLYHHRGQLGVYLRLLGAQVPSAYGPSGDEMPPEFEKMRAAIGAKA